MRAPMLLTLTWTLTWTLACACACGDAVVVYDVFQPNTNPSTDALHTYASHAQVPLRARSLDIFRGIDDVIPAASDGLTLDPDTKVERSGDGVLSFAVLTGDPGKGTLTFHDKGGGAVATRTLDVVDADTMALDVTAPATAGIELPTVALDKARIFSGGTAAFRTTLLAGGTEIVGLKAVTATPADASVTTRNGAGCAADTCSDVRNAVAIGVPAATTAPVDVALRAGTATASIHVVPTAAADVTDLVFDVANVVGGKGDVVAHVLAGTEPVFGAPVVWTVDDKVLDDKDGKAIAGDALQFDVAPPNSNPNFRPATHDVTATLGDKTAATTVVGETFTVTSITAACGSTSSTWATLMALALLLKRRRL